MRLWIVAVLLFLTTPLAWSQSTTQLRDYHSIWATSTIWGQTTFDLSIYLDDQEGVRFLEEDASGTNYVALRAPATVAGDVTWTLPSADSAGCWRSDGAGVLSFVGCPAGGSAPSSATFVVMSLDATLSAERVLAEGTAIDLTDGGANGNATVAFDSTEVGTTTWGTAGATWTFEGGAVDPTLAWSSALFTIDSPTFAVDTTNNRVGIGTAAPGQTLHAVAGNGAGTVQMKFESTGTTAGDRGLFTATSTGVEGYFQSYPDTTPDGFVPREDTISLDAQSTASALLIGTIGAVPIHFYTGGDVCHASGNCATADYRRVTIDGTGLVRIGGADTTPDASLEIINDGAGDSLLVADTNDGDTSSFGVDSSGGVFVGATSVAAGKMDVRTTTDKHLLVRQASDFGGAATAVALHSVNDGAAAGIPLEIESSALYLNAITESNVGIGTTGPSATLHVREATVSTEVLRIESVATNDDPAERVYQARTTTSDATATTLWEFTPVANTTIHVEAIVLGRDDADDEAATYHLADRCDHNGAAVGCDTTDVVAISEADATWDAVITTTGASAGTFRVAVTGAVGDTVTWHATIRIYTLGT